MSPSIITLDALGVSAPDGRRLFDNLTLSFGAERTGLVGRNGVGKTTLLRVILGELAPQKGAVSVTGRLGVLRQSVAPPTGAILTDVLGARADLERLVRIETGEGTDADLSDADWTLPQRLEAALAEVGLAGFTLERPATSLSGGELTRAALAGLLASEPDLLILDEPTNNLDAGARQMVAQVLARRRGGAIVVSHDRALLEPMDRIVELSTLGAEVCGGGFSFYAERKAEARALAEHRLEEAERAADRISQEVQAVHERKEKRDSAGKKSRARNDQPKMFLNYQANRAARTGGRQARLGEKLKGEAAADLESAREGVERISRMAFDLPPTDLASGKLVLAFEAVSFAWAGRPILEDVSFRITGPERVAVTGPNGAGKSTLLNLASGDLLPESGVVRRPVAAAIFDQTTSLLRDDQTLVENFLRLNPQAGVNQAQAVLARFLFRNLAAQKRAAALSGGERLRAALACVLGAARPPPLLILDEPTNHLDLDSIEAIETALAGFDGALIVVSHDTAFLEAIGIQRTLAL